GGRVEGASRCSTKAESAPAARAPSTGLRDQPAQAARNAAIAGSISAAGTSDVRRAPSGTLVVIRSPGNRSIRLTDGVASPRSAAPGANGSRAEASGPPVQTGTPASVPELVTWV